MKWLLGLATCLSLAGCTFILWEPEDRLYLIPRGAHYPIQPVGTRLYDRPTQLHLVATFDSTCIYDIGPDQGDINKLWGYGFLGSKHQDLRAAHRVDSFRFGWRWHPQRQRIQVLAYVYDARNTTPEHILHEVVIGQPVELSLTIDYERGEYRTGETVIKFQHRKWWAYALGPYFGGNQRAPHSIQVRIRD